MFANTNLRSSNAQLNFPNKESNFKKYIKIKQAGCEARFARDDVGRQLQGQELP